MGLDQETIVKCYFHTKEQVTPGLVKAVNEVKKYIEMYDERVVSVAIKDSRLSKWIRLHDVKLSKKRICSCSLLGKRCVDYSTARHGPPGLDHADIWQRDGKAVVITSQPYAWPLSMDWLQPQLDFCRKHGFDLRISEEGWYYPGYAALIEYWAPGVEKMP